MNFQLLILSFCQIFDSRMTAWEPVSKSIIVKASLPSNETRSSGVTLKLKLPWTLDQLERMDAFDLLALRAALKRAVRQIENIQGSQARFFHKLGVPQKYQSISRWNTEKIKKTHFYRWFGCSFSGLTDNCDRSLTGDCHWPIHPAGWFPKSF